MTLIALESWDGIATADLNAKGWTGLVNTPTITTEQSKTGANSLKLVAAGSEAATGKATKTLGAAEHATVIFGGALFITGTGVHMLLRFSSDGAATSHITLRCTETGTIEVRRGLGTGTVIGTTTATIPRNTWHYLECRVTLSDTVGVVELRLNGVTILNLTNQDTKNAGTKTVIDSITLCCGTGTTGDLGYWDDVYILNAAGADNNTFLGEIRVRCLLPNANGASSQLVGSDSNSVDNYQLVNEVPPDPASYVGSATADQKDTYGFGNIPDGSGTVKGVQINAYASKTDAGLRSIALVTRSAGSDYDGSDQALSTSNLFYNQIRELDPATSAAWTRAAVDSAEFGVKVR